MKMNRLDCIADYDLDCLSDNERRHFNVSAKCIFETHPFVILLDELKKYTDIKKREIKPYFVNRFGNEEGKNYEDKSDTYFIKYMPFNILLNRIDVHNPLYEKICLYVYDKIKNNIYDVRDFIFFTSGNNRLLPDKIIEDLISFKDPLLYYEARSTNEKIEASYNGGDADKEVPKEIVKNYSRDGFEDNIVSCMLIEILSCTPMVIDSLSFKTWGISKDDTLYSWFVNNFSNDPVFFHIAYNRLYKEGKYDELNKLIKLVETDIGARKNSYYTSFYVFSVRVFNSYVIRNRKLGDNIWFFQYIDEKYFVADEEKASRLFDSDEN